MSNDLLNIIDNYPDEIKYNALHTLVLFTYIFYSNNSEFPEFDDLRKINYTSFVRSEKKNDLNNDEWKNIFQAYGYNNTNNFDLLIHDGVNHGYFDDLKIINEANVLTDQVNINKSKESIHAAWDLYHNSFNTNECDLINAFEQLIRNHSKNISPETLNSIIDVLRVLNKNDLADDLIDFTYKKDSLRLTYLIYLEIILLFQREIL